MVIFSKITLLLYRTMMKKLSLLVAMVIFALTSNAQTLLGIPFNGDAKVFVNKLVKEKGFVLDKSNVDGSNTYILSGKILGYQCEVIVLGTSKTNQVCKMVAYTPNATTFSDLTSTFNSIYTLLEAKYGKNDRECIDYFTTPYERGDGYEISAIKLGKYIRMCMFGENEPNLSAYEIIEKYAQVKLVWENKENMQLLKKERLESAKDEL